MTTGAGLICFASAQARCVAGRQLEQDGGTALDGHQHMAGIELAQVHESQRQLILMDAGRSNIAGDQAAEDALAGWRGIDEVRHGVVSGKLCVNDNRGIASADFLD